MWFRRSSNLSQAPDAKFMAELRADLLHRYSKRRSDKLAGKEPVNLRKISADIGVSGEVMTLKAEQVSTAMFDLFVEGRGRLLLSGVPGAGKTTLLLQLAEAQLNSPHKELPVLLNLASWRSSFKNLDEWLAEVLYLELSTNRVGADQVRQTIPLILLLDGLDEVPESDRSSCLAAIGEYGADANRQFAVSCRKEELKALEEFIPTNIYLPIEVAQLTPEQIETQLLAWSFNQPEAKPLLQAIRQDAPLLEALRTPFFLNTAQLLFASGKRWEQFGFSKTEDVKIRESELLERFITEALKPGWRNHSAAQVEHWLSFLASRMNREGLVVFELRDLQYDWWKWGRHQFALAGASKGVGIFGLFGSICSCLIFEIFEKGYGFIGFSVGLFSLVFLSAVVAAFEKTPPEIWTNDYWDWSFSRFSESLKRVRILWLSIAILYSVFIAYLAWNETNDFLKTLIWTLLGILAGLSILPVPILLAMLYNSPNLLIIKTPYQRFRASAKRFHFSILQHWHLRWLLFRKNLLPLRLVFFLNDMAIQHFMETNGATWRFRHRMVQEYFANKWKGE